MNYTNSSLITCTNLSPNHSGTRTHTIDRFTPHCVVGQCTAKRIGEIFAKSSRKASCNYGIGKDGDVVLVVDEANRSWCSSSSANDQRAITVEVASDSTSPYAFTDAAYNKLIDLGVDICKRYNKTKVVWINDKAKALAYTPADDEILITVHRWFANKACPGDWLMNKMSSFADSVNARLASKTSTSTSSSTSSKVESTSSSTKTSSTTLPNVPFKVKTLIKNLNIRSEPKMGLNIVGTTGVGTFTITEVSGTEWGKLKSGKGWIYIANSKYVKILK